MSTITSLVDMPSNRMRFDVMALWTAYRAVARDLARRTVGQSAQALVGVMQVRQPAAGPDARRPASPAITRLAISPAGSPESRQESRA
jgi:hypothetical protein